MVAKRSSKGEAGPSALRHSSIPRLRLHQDKAQTSQAIRVIVLPSGWCHQIPHAGAAALCKTAEIYWQSPLYQPHCLSLFTALSLLTFHI